MTRLSQIGWACACVALLAPAAARADSVSVMTSVYEASFLRLPAEPEHGRPGTTIFSWCRRCSAPDASPYLVSTNVSPMSSSAPNGGFTVAFNGGFSAVFGGTITFPVPAVTSTTTPGSSGSSGPSITLPSTRDDDHGDHHGEQGDHNRGDHGDHGPVSLAGGANGGPNHDPGKIKDKFDHVAGGVSSTGRSALSKAEKLAATPEPATLFLLGTGLVGIAGRAWKRRG